jgi:hypothetical protein
MPEEPIEIVPGVYKKSGGTDVVGLCIVLDNQDGKWDVTTSDHYTTTIKIKKDAIWKVEEYADPMTGKQKVRIFCEDGKLNSLALKHFIHPTEEVYTPNAHAPKNEWPELKIFYTTPNDSQAPPIKIP